VWNTGKMNSSKVHKSQGEHQLESHDQALKIVNQPKNPQRGLLGENIIESNEFPRG